MSNSVVHTSHLLLHCIGLEAHSTTLRQTETATASDTGSYVPYIWRESMGYHKYLECFPSVLAKN